jgi:hypothetical protein
VVAKHVGFQNRAIFRRTDGTMFEANIVKQETPALSNGATGDVQMCQFDRDVVGCENVWLFPPNISEYIPSLDPSWYQAYPQDPITNLPITPFTLARTITVMVSLVRENNSSLGNSFYGGRKLQPFSVLNMINQLDYGTIGVPYLRQFTQGFRNNDSGSPVFVPMKVGGKKVCVLLTSLGGGDPAYNKFADSFNISMNRMATQAGLPGAGSYACKVMDLSAYPKFTT